MTMFAAACLCTNQHSTDAATVWHCGGADMAQGWRSSLSLNNMHLLLFVLAFFVRHPVNDVGWY